MLCRTLVKLPSLFSERETNINSETSNNRLCMVFPLYSMRNNKERRDIVSDFSSDMLFDLALLKHGLLFCKLYW